MACLVARAIGSKSQSSCQLIRHCQRRHYSLETEAQGYRPTFGIAFDIDGVLLRGRTPIGGAPQALRRLYTDPSNPTELRVPFVFLTNGGGVRESIRASELGSLLGVRVLPHQAAFPTERLGMGAFRIALEGIFNRIHHTPLRYTSFGKPNAAVFKDAETVLQKLATGLPPTDQFETLNEGNGTDQKLNILYMVGDNPAVDIYGVHQAGPPWFSILTRTGCFKMEGNHERFPADLVVNTVEDAVDYILNKHSREHLEVLKVV